MDPKMDSGYLAPGETLEDDYDVSKDILPEEVIGIIDQLLCHEVGIPSVEGSFLAHAFYRWLGIWVILFHRLYSLVSILMIYSSQDQFLLMAHALIERLRISVRSRFRYGFFVHIVLVLSKHATMSITA
jgi:hypothetical protein